MFEFGGSNPQLTTCRPDVMEATFVGIPLGTINELCPNIVNATVVSVCVTNRDVNRFSGRRLQLIVCKLANLRITNDKLVGLIVYNQIERNTNIVIKSGAALRTLEITSALCNNRCSLITTVDSEVRLRLLSIRQPTSVSITAVADILILSNVVVYQHCQLIAPVCAVLYQVKAESGIDFKIVTPNMWSRFASDVKTAQLDIGRHRFRNTRRITADLMTGTQEWIKFIEYVNYICNLNDTLIDALFAAQEDMHM